jgi:hypothetical protein
MKKGFRLPSHEEMLERLLKVSEDPVLVDRFYPRLLKQADERCTQPSDVVMLLQLAIFNCEGVSPVLGAKLHSAMPSLIDALAPNAEVAKEARGHWSGICADIQSVA